MNERPSCATPEALITYLYEECDPAERTSIAAHVAICAWCAEDVRVLSDTRAHLTSWSPPALPLGFQITRTESDQPAKVLRPAAWWRQPLPAWAQAAAAVVIFAAGMSVNAFRSPDEPPARVAQAPAVEPVVAAERPDDLSVTREEFVRLESRLRAIERADVSRASYVQATDRGADSEDLRAQLETLKSQVAVDRRVNEFFREKVGPVIDSNRDDLVAIRGKIPLMDQELQGHRKVLLDSAFLTRASLTNVR